MSYVQELLDLWAEAMWRASWQGGFAAVFVVIVCRIWPATPARFQCWLWRLVLLKFVVTLFWVAPLEIPLLTAAAQGTPLSDQTKDLAPWQTATAGSELVDQTMNTMTLVMFLFAGWLVICCWKFTRIFVAWRYTKQLRNRCVNCDHMQLHKSLAKLSKQAGYGTMPELLELPGYGSPLLIGIRQPAIVFPKQTLNQLDAREQTLVLGHELAHVERRDLLHSLAAAVIRAVFFFHPLVWISERRLGLAQEIAADELAIARQKQDPVRYASLLVSVIGKLGPRSNTPALSVGVAGSPRSLQQRISAMRLMKPSTVRSRISCAILLGLVVIFGLVPWTIVATAADQPEAKELGETKSAEKSSDKTPEQAPAKTPDRVPEQIAQKEKNHWGKFVSFEAETLTIELNSGEKIANKIPANAQTLLWNQEQNKYLPVERTAGLSKAAVGTWMVVGIGKDSALVRIGARKGSTTGTFISFKDNRLLMLGKDLGPSYTKKYGNQLHMNKFRDDVHAYESVDGGEYKKIGNANKVLGDVKEGAIITVHGEGDDNVTLIQIGVPKKP